MVPEKPTSGLASQNRVSSELSEELVAKHTELGPVFAATVGVVMWLVILIDEGPMAGLETSWLLLIALPLGARTLLMRLHFTSERLSMTVGPWQRQVDLRALESIHWKWTRTGPSAGTIFVRDRTGRRVPIYVGHFARADEWGPLLLDAAEHGGASVDCMSRRLLQGELKAETK